MTKMNRQEVVVEIEWLLDAGMSPIYISETLGRSAEALVKLAQRAGNRRIVQAFNRDCWVHRCKRQVQHESR